MGGQRTIRWKTGRDDLAKRLLAAIPEASARYDGKLWEVTIPRKCEADLMSVVNGVIEGVE